MPPESQAPFAPWPSPISTTDVARSGLGLGFPTVLGEEVWWEESRPAEGGRRTVVHRAEDGTRRELLAAPWDARTRVHEYGGRSYVVVPGRGIVFTHHADQRLYFLEEDAQPRALTPEPELPAGLRYADLLVHEFPHGTEVWCVQERHHPDATVTRSIVSITLPPAAQPDATPDGRPLAIVERASGSDFYASPAVSPDGEHVAYICWNHPRMPWVGTELRITSVADGRSWTIKGGVTESVLAPRWRDDRNLYLISDWSGWWNLYQIGIFGTSPLALFPAEEEFAGPLWQLGGLPYLVLEDGRLAVVHGRGDLRLGVLDPHTGVLTDVDVPYQGWMPAFSADGTVLAGIAYGPDTPRSVVRIDMVTGRVEGLRRDIPELPDVAYLPRPRAVEIEGGLGRRVHGNLYPPANPDHAAEGLSPYVVFVHGGPTAHATTALSLDKAFFTSRGIGVLDVNYGGSTGYGRAYRERLRGQWGIADVEDTVAAAKWLASEGLADPARIAIRGESAGGWTVMAACCASGVFAGGVAVAGVSALEPFVAATHDFESRYVEWLVGPESLYGSREPLSRADEVTCPMLLMQGLADPVVPPSQSQAFADRLTARDVPCTYLTFEGEAHGFRRLETRTAALAAELSFYLQIFQTTG
ncbi:S9 family peptidase [Planotetraspora kaengkrachanensis]|uniref:Acyl-peptide hydrolase n=1 Tax=Planotetraspora kaengkrachanensis TaxID=575193 RepID=A0A8J3M4Q8_9ACTN|nr:prolyl oligopeptidase family serine peptidase [Planotetraspora kaengkrachanensis]GIG79225.1 acyl-peptide hydrolase [Planotetraspora kaengkrachanensis]